MYGSRIYFLKTFLIITLLSADVNDAKFEAF